MRETHELEEALHHHFKNPALLVTALTHTSYANEAKHGVRHNERLEFLGDSVLSIVVAEYLFTHKNMPEGELTRMRASLVCEAALFEFAKQISLGDYLRLGRGEERGGGRCRPSILSDAFEAVIAALYLDGGIEAARAFVARTLFPQMSAELALEPENPKSALQEKLQEDGITPTYKLVETQGPPHDRTFVAQVFAGSQGLALGTGRTKKEAESQAAKSTLARLGEFFGLGMDDKARAVKAEAQAKAKAEKAEAAAKARAAKAEEKARRKTERELAKQQRKAGQ